MILQTYSIININLFLSCPLWKRKRFTVCINLANLSLNSLACVLFLNHFQMNYIHRPFFTADILSGKSQVQLITLTRFHFSTYRNAKQQLVMLSVTPVFDKSYCCGQRSINFGFTSHFYHDDMCSSYNGSIGMKDQLIPVNKNCAATV